MPHSIPSPRPLRQSCRLAALGALLFLLTAMPDSAVGQDPVAIVQRIAWHDSGDSVTALRGSIPAVQATAFDASGVGVPGARVRVFAGPDASQLQVLAGGAELTADAAGVVTVARPPVPPTGERILLVLEAADGVRSAALVLRTPAMVPDRATVEQPLPTSWPNGVRVQPSPALRILSGGLPVPGTPVRLVSRSVSAEVSGHQVVTNDAGLAEFPNLVVRSGDCPDGTCTRVVFDVRAGREDVLMPDVTLTFDPARVGPTTLVVSSGGGTEVKLGEALRPGVQVRALLDSAAGTAARRVGVVVFGERGETLGQAETDDNGLVMFTSLRPRGRVGRQRLLFVSGVAQRAYDVTVLPGEPRSMNVVTHPLPRLHFDSLWKAAPVVQVVDSSGNPVPNVEVRARLCGIPQDDRAPLSILTWLARLGRNKGGANQQQNLNRADPNCIVHDTELASLSGINSRRTDSLGRATFDSLSFRGRAGRYWLVFAAAPPYQSVAPVSSIDLIHAPVRDYDQNFVVISAIKTISGAAPEDEFFDLRFRFRLGSAAHVLANTDVALSNRDSDSVSSPQRRLTEASLQLNGNLFTATERASEIPQRLLFAGAQLKVFNTVQYYGLHVGGTEMGGSPFQGSSLSVSLLRRWYSDSLLAIEGDTVRTARYNVGVDFFLRSSRIDFFRVLTIRGAVLVPLGDPARPTARITIAVPVGDMYAW